MKLVYANASPFVRKVMVALIETGQRDKVELEDVFITPLKSGETAPSANPLGKIPSLMLDDGSSLFDSRVICRYIDAQHTGPKLYPEGATLWPRLALEALADGIMDAAVLMVYEHRLRPEELWSSDWVEAQWLKISRALADLNSHTERLEPTDMASMAVGVALGYLDFRHADRNWRALAPELANWEASFAERPAMVATSPIYRS